MKTLILSLLALAYNSASFDLLTEAPNERPPKIRLVVRDEGGKEIDLTGGIRGTGLGTLRVTVEPDESFKGEKSNAVYHILQMEVIMVRGKTRVATMNATNGNFDMRFFTGQLQPGDRIVINVTSVTRTVGEREEKVDVPQHTLSIPIQ